MRIHGIEIAEEHLRLQREKRNINREHYYREARIIMGKEATEELARLMDLYDERIYLWFAGLFDPEIGGFYYSRSARQTEGYLPDLESTAQALQHFEDSGLTSDPSGEAASWIPRSVEKKVVAFVKGLEDPEDGYFYHKQWGKSISENRRGRDLTWAIGILDRFGEKPPYPTALERISEESVYAKEPPEHLSSLPKFREYLRSMDLGNASYRYGNIIQSQATQIRAAGEEYVRELISYLEYNQKGNGLWQSEINYHGVNGLLKMIHTYGRLGKSLPRSEEALKSAIAVAASREEVSFCYEVYNPISAINHLIKNIKATEGRARAEQLRELVVEHAQQIIGSARKKLVRFQKQDGVFSYFLDKTSSCSQGQPVAVEGSNEGDVNATVMATTEMINGICELFAIPRIPIFSRSDGAFFFSLLRSAEKIKKDPKAQKVMESNDRPKQRRHR